MNIQLNPKEAVFSRKLNLQASAEDQAAANHTVIYTLVSGKFLRSTYSASLSVW